MKAKSKVILGLKKPSEFSLEERKAIIEEWIVTGNHPTYLDFSGFFGAVFLTVGK